MNHAGIQDSMSVEWRQIAIATAHSLSAANVKWTRHLVALNNSPIGIRMTRPTLASLRRSYLKRIAMA